jgi:hypothetical protein
MSDERAALPSASSAGRYFTCPGSFLLEQQVTDPEVSSSDATTGNRIHGRLAGEQIELTDDELSLAVKCTNDEENIVQDVFGIVGSADLLPIRERRFWAYDANLARDWSGKPDVVYRKGSRVLIIDYKTGRGTVEHATGNLQLRALAVLAADHFGDVNEVTVAIIQPLAGPPSRCTYSGEDLDMARFQINELMADVKRPGQPRVPLTDACKYCRAKPICPEARGVVEKLPALVPRDGLEIVMSPEQIAEFLEKAPLAEAVIEAVRGKARRMLEAKQEIPGWKLKPGATRESITNPELAFARFMDAGGTQAQFVQSITVAKTKFKDAVKAATGKKGKDLDGFLEIMLEGCTETKVTAPSLVKEKESN